VIRPFVHGDIAHVTRLLQENLQEAPLLRGESLDMAMVVNTLFHPMSAGWLSFGDDGELRGGIFVHETPSFFGRRVLQDLFLYVRKPFRNGVLAYKLIKIAERYGQTIGCARITLSDSTRIHGAATLYTRMGYRLTASSHSRELL